jgi:sugar/nucleoside kinase (ribokinase family)
VYKRQALVSLNQDATLLGFVGPGGTPSRVLLDSALVMHPLPHRLFEVLVETSVAFISLNKADGRTPVYGARGKLDADKTYSVMCALRSLEISSVDFVVASGVLASELPFAEVLFEKVAPGFRLFGPKKTLCGTKVLREFLPRCDLLILNQEEWEQCSMTFQEVHEIGPKLVVVTQDERGCSFSLDGVSGNVEAFRASQGPFYTTGAGDWFFGGLVAAMMQKEVSVTNLTEPILRECLGFAAKVAGLKVMKAGGTFGPTLAEVLAI